MPTPDGPLTEFERDCSRNDTRRLFGDGPCGCGGNHLFPGGPDHTELRDHLRRRVNLRLWHGEFLELERRQHLCVELPRRGRGDEFAAKRVSFTGTYTAGSGTTTGSGGEWVSTAQNQDGGVAGQKYPELYGGPAVGMSNTSSYNLALSSAGVPGINYFGVWISALDPFNDLRIYSGTTMIAELNSATLLADLVRVAGHPAVRIAVTRRRSSAARIRRKCLCISTSST